MTSPMSTSKPPLLTAVYFWPCRMRKVGSTFLSTPSMELSTRASWVEKVMRLRVSHSKSMSRVASASASSRTPAAAS